MTPTPTLTTRSEIAAVRASLIDLTVDQLKAALAAQITTTAREVERLAAIWIELERRGEDMSSFRTGIARYLPAVAAGRLASEAVIRLAGNQTTLRALAALEPEEQRRLLDAGTVEVAGESGPRSVPLHLLSPTEVHRAFDAIAGRVRTPAEQSVVVRGKRRTQQRVRVVLMLTEAEHQALQAAARRTGRSASTLAVEALRNEKLI